MGNSLNESSMSTFQPGPANDSAASLVDNPNGGLDQTTGSSPQQEAFGCGLCEKVFSRRENLSRHRKTHDTPSHCCPKCGKGFTRSDLMKRHEAGHERWDHDTAKTRRRPVKKRKAGEDEEWTDENIPNSPHLASGRSSEMPDPDSTRSPMTSNQSVRSGEGYHAVLADSHIQPPQGSMGQAQGSVPCFPTNPADLPSFEYDLTDVSYAPFDFSSFLAPQDMTPLDHEWFSFDFYSAMRETGNDWGSLGSLGSSPGLPDTWTSVDQPSREAVDNSQISTCQDLHHDGFDSRISSPPNEASEEDKWAFQWNPDSKQILTARPISIPDNHPFFQLHNPRFDITEATLSRLRSFLQPQFPEYPSAKRSFVLPPLKVVNIFIELFFQHFSPQMPVIHHATVNTNTDLPAPLLAAIIVIGATYSHLKHTRRFAIVLLDVARWHLQVALECNNSLMRNAMIVYAEALIVHTGLWCGNKRAFSLAEVGRGALITYMRRAQLGESLPNRSTRTSTSTLDSAWRHWIDEESRKRLAWVIYAIDSQFPSLLNLPPTVSIGEVRDLGCPCDEEFWAAGSARTWKQLLGPATVPPSRLFSAAVGPFVLGRDVGHESDQPDIRQRQSLILSLNPWSAFLVLVTITHQIFQVSQEEAVSKIFIDEDDSCSKEADSSGSGNVFSLFHVARRPCIADSLEAFHSAYLSSHDPNRDPSTEYFTRSSHTLHKLSTILLAIPLPDIQNAIGKDGTAGIAQAMPRLLTWARSSPNNAEQVAHKVVQAIMFLTPNDRQGGHMDTAPYSLIVIFLCHVIFWVFISVSKEEQITHLLQRLELDLDIRQSSLFVSILRDDGSGEERDLKMHKKILFRSGAEMLTRFGTWGASLDLAMLLQRRAEM